jgi:hypothetical protein
MKAMFLMKTNGYAPVLPEDRTYYTVYCARIDGWGLYEVSATAPDLNELRDMPDVIELQRRGVPEPGETEQPYKDMPISGTVRTRINQWIQDNYPEWDQLEQIEPGQKVGDVLEYLAELMGNSAYTTENTSIKELE